MNPEGKLELLSPHSPRQTLIIILHVEDLKVYVAFQIKGG